jgi:hypothetical protein
MRLEQTGLPSRNGLVWAWAWADWLWLGSNDKVEQIIVDGLTSLGKKAPLCLLCTVLCIPYGAIPRATMVQIKFNTHNTNLSLILSATQGPIETTRTQCSLQKMP